MKVVVLRNDDDIAEAINLVKSVEPDVIVGSLVMTNAVCNYRNRFMPSLRLGDGILMASPGWLRAYKRTHPTTEYKLPHRVTTKGTRAGKPVDVRFAVEKYGGSGEWKNRWVLRIDRGGVTGHEAVFIEPNFIECTEKRGWMVCAGGAGWMACAGDAGWMACAGGAGHDDLYIDAASMRFVHQELNTRVYQTSPDRPLHPTGRSVGEDEGPKSSLA